MGNGNSTTSKTRGKQRAMVASTGPHYVASMQRKVSTKPELVGFGARPAAPAEQDGKKPLHDDDTFSNYIQRAKYKMRSMSKIGQREKQNDPAPVDVTNANSTNNNNKENEKDQFSDFIQNARKKLRTVSTKNGSFRRG
ncbi:hypothetical protein VNO77_15600 [Canavalia gladiata]|uniref:Uncharacterized protein n=1 Tax=Canavalia gladiata TaxID=3824 RepID=A0AAN9LZP6_CANGL